jgi:3-isopropylmalate/(R)-2-methylmalate dehydratase small subunit
MSGWRTHSGAAIALDVENIDTDQLIPARFMSTPRSEGYGGFLLHDMRFATDGAPLPDAPLNRHPGASVLVTQRNFGTGSSREAAVYALVDFGIQAVIAPSFGDIFAANAVNNGLLPARVAPEVAKAMIAALGAGASEAQIDLPGQTVTVAGHAAPFTLDPVWREKLINGWDDIDLTAQHSGEITAHRARYSQMQPWAFPSGETAQ